MTTAPTPGEPAPPPGYPPEALEAAGFPTISFDRLVVGETFRSDDKLIRPQDVETYAFAVDDDDPLFFGANPGPRPIVHPTLLANQALFLRHNRYVVPAGLHARMSFEFLRPIELGTRARTVGTVADTYVRRHKPYMVTEFETRAEQAPGGGPSDGEPLVRGRFVQMLFASPTAPPSGSAPSPAPDPPAVDPDVVEAVGRHGAPIRVGATLGPLIRTISQRQIDAYSGVKPRSIHTDPTWATAKGFPTTIAQGMMTTAYASALMTSALGMGFVAGGRMDVRFLTPVPCGTTLTVTGTVDGFSPGDDEGTVRMHVTVEARNEWDEITMAGTASGVAMAPPGRT
ncbi:MAG: MaoC/PaaZ C-terminal domain-containing protein [Acidimicrobiales bacterium]